MAFSQFIVRYSFFQKRDIFFINHLLQAYTDIGAGRTNIRTSVRHSDTLSISLPIMVPVVQWCNVSVYHGCNYHPHLRK